MVPNYPPHRQSHHNNPGVFYQLVYQIFNMSIQRLENTSPKRAHGLTRLDSDVSNKLGEVTSFDRFDNAGADISPEYQDINHRWGGGNEVYDHDIVAPKYGHDKGFDFRGTNRLQRDRNVLGSELITESPRQEIHHAMPYENRYERNERDKTFEPTTGLVTSGRQIGKHEIQVPEDEITETVSSKQSRNDGKVVVSLSNSTI